MRTVCVGLVLFFLGGWLSKVAYAKPPAVEAIDRQIRSGTSRQAGYIREMKFESTGIWAYVRPADIFEGVEAEREVAKDYPDWVGTDTFMIGMDPYIKTRDTETRKFLVDPQAVILLISSPGSLEEPYRLSLKRYAQLQRYHQAELTESHPKDKPYWFVFQGQKVVKIIQVYVP